MKIWADKQPEILLAKYGSPLYVYDERTIQAAAKELKDGLPKNAKILYSCKANTNVEIMRTIVACGLGINICSWEEMYLAREAGAKYENMFYTCSGASKEELEGVILNGCLVVCDSLRQIASLGELALTVDVRIGIRVNLGHGYGSHPNVKTGQRTKFGICVRQIDEAFKLADDLGIKIEGVHQHVGSGILDSLELIDAYRCLAALARRHTSKVLWVDFGGGFGVPYEPGKRQLDIRVVGEAVDGFMNEVMSESNHRIFSVFEPGRFLVAQAGMLLTRVMDVKDVFDQKFVIVDSGFNHFARPMLYDAYHRIDNVSYDEQQHENLEDTNVCGNLCESGDVFAAHRRLPHTRIGDVLAICDVGAYGYSMASNYNSRGRPAEVMITDDGHDVLIRARELQLDLFARNVRRMK